MVPRLTTQQTFLLAQQRHLAGQLAEAEQLCRQVLAQQPNHAHALHLLGLVAHQVGRDEMASELIGRALALSPADADFHLSLGKSLTALRRWDQAIAAFRRALNLRPDHPWVHKHLGRALVGKNDFNAAIDSFRRAAQLLPNDHEVVCNLGNSLGEAGAFDQALDCFRRSLALKPDFAMAHFNLGVMLLRHGDWAPGWAEYEWRWRVPGLGMTMPYSQPFWDGGNLSGRRILLPAEQGFGDAIQFVRLVPQIARYGGKVLAACHPALFDLFKTVPGVDVWLKHGDVLPDFDVQCPLMSLPSALKLTSVPASAPYLFPDPFKVEQWRRRMEHEKRFKIGLVWAAGAPRENERLWLRSFSLSALAPLSAVTDSAFFSLQKGEPAAQARSSPMPLTDWSAELNDFSDTAALIANLDLIISVDTAVVHLAGALGKPVWVFLPYVSDWRWSINRADSAWYPTMTLFRQTRPGDWTTPIRQVVESLPSHRDGIPRVKLGHAAFQQKNWEQAIGRFQAALVNRPDDLEARMNLALVFRELQRWDQAAEHCRLALTAHPNCPDAYNTLGVALFGLERFDEAIAALSQAIALRPDYAEAYTNLGNAHSGKEDWPQAAESYRQAIRLRPSDPDAQHNLAVALRQTQLWEQSIAACNHVLALRPDYFQAYNTMGFALHGLGRYGEAEAAYRECLSLRPDFAEAHWNLGLCRLTQGDFQEGWREYEWRWQVKQTRQKFNFPRPWWRGEDLNGRRILLHPEQGLGDCIQFARYIPLVARLGGKVVFASPPPLLRIFSGLEGMECLASADAPLPDFDLHCPLLSLPGALKTTLSDIPATVPYLSAEPRQIQHWHERLAGDDRQKIGLVWAGRPSYGNDHNRSMPLSDFAALAEIPRVRLFSLQKGHAAAQIRGSSLELTDWTADLNDFADTAALIANLDLVISVDTAVAHLAGALGKPVWVLLPFVPDWRWMLSRADSPWYPTMRLFRQDRIGDWASPIARLVEAVKERGKNR
jgi:tetratricopeptide (TPR) repeat protein/ADP-heptose:LPS heptosyltransferase